MPSDTRAGRDRLTSTEYIAEHRHTIAGALRNDAASALADAETMRRCARAIRGGQSLALFAPGEPGAVAADHLAAQHDHRRTAALDALSALEGGIDDGYGGW